MNPYWLLLPVFAVNAIGSYVTYDDSIRDSKAYSPIMTVLGGAFCALFAYGASISETREKVFIFSLLADLVMAVCYYLLPLLIFAVRPSLGVLAGTGLIAIGLIVLKLSHE